MKALAGKLCIIIKGENIGKQCRPTRLYEGGQYVSATGAPIWWCKPESSNMHFICAGTHLPWTGPIGEFLATESALMPIDPDETILAEKTEETKNARV